MLRPGDTIEYLEDVSSPPNQKGITGQTKVIDQDIPMWTAKFLLRGGKVRPYDPENPLIIKKEKTEPELIPRQRRTRERRTYVRTEAIGEANQAGDTEPEKSDSEGKV